MAWERTLAAKVVALSVSPDARCVVAATTAGLVLLNSDGDVLWERPYFNQWMAAAAEQGDSHALAVAPQCRWIAVAGSQNYRYVWLLGADGHPRAHLATPGTPQAIAISHRGDQLVVATAAGHLLFVGPHGHIRRNVSLRERMVVDAVEFSPDDAFVLTPIAIGTVGLFTRGGDTVWTRTGPYMHVWASNDWQRFLVQSEPMHGVSIDSVEIIARDGRTVWLRDGILSAIAKMSPDGGRFMIASAPRRANDEFYLSEYASQQMAPTVLDRNGTILSEGHLPSEEMPRAGSAMRCELSEYHTPLVCRDQNAKALWQVSDILGHELRSYTPDLGFLVIARATGAVPVVRGYRPSRVGASRE